jgi:hypothetical protein
VSKEARQRDERGKDLSADELEFEEDGGEGGQHVAFDEDEPVRFSDVVQDAVELCAHLLRTDITHARARHAHDTRKSVSLANARREEQRGELYLCASSARKYMTFSCRKTSRLLLSTSSGESSFASALHNFFFFVFQ